MPLRFSPKRFRSNHLYNSVYLLLHTRSIVPKIANNCIWISFLQHTSKGLWQDEKGQGSRQGEGRRRERLKHLCSSFSWYNRSYLLSLQMNPSPNFYLTAWVSAILKAPHLVPKWKSPQWVVCWVIGYESWFFLSPKLAPAPLTILLCQVNTWVTVTWAGKSWSRRSRGVRNAEEVRGWPQTLPTSFVLVLPQGEKKILSFQNFEKLCNILYKWKKV